LRSPTFIISTEYKRPLPVCLPCPPIKPSPNLQSEFEVQPHIFTKTKPLPNQTKPPPPPHISKMHRRAARTTPVRSTRTQRPGMLTRLRARAGGRRAAPVTTTTTTTTTTRREQGGVGVGAAGVGGTGYKRSRFGRRSRHNHAGYGTTTGVAAQPMRRRASIGDKVSGALMKLRGSLTRRPGLKV
jgi:hypothetical protein